MRNKSKRLWIALGAALSMLMSSLPVMAQAEVTENAGFEALEPNVLEGGGKILF